MAYHNTATRVLQELSPNVRVDYSASSSRGPVLKVDLSSRFAVGDSFSANRECFLNNKAGDHVLRHRDFYQLTDQERFHYNWLLAEANSVPKYKRYREGQGQKPKGNQDVWDSTREDLFFKGLVKFPPTGRDKKGYPPFGNESRTYGRNEHIAFYINDILGEVTAEYLKDPPDGDKGKARKQVSSHLQVLKKMFDGRPRLIAWMASSEKDPGQRPKRATSLAERTKKKVDPYPRPGLRRMHSAAGSSLPEPSAVLPSQGSAAALPELKPDEFRITLCNENKAAIHTYTAWHKTKGPAHDLDALPKSQWTQHFPLLEGIIAEVGGDCSVLHAETTLALADIDTVYDGKNLTIESTHLCNAITGLGHGYHVYNQFYNDLVSVAHHKADCPLMMEGPDPLVHVPFFSTHWTEVLMKYATALKQAGEAPGHGLREPENVRITRLNQARGTIDEELRRMTAIQKITHSTVNSHARTTEKAVLVIYWKFGLTKSNAEMGTTTFRDFILPPVSRIMPDIWATNDRPIHGVKHEESSFAIRDENSSYDNAFEMPYHHMKLEDQLAYPFNEPAHLGSLDFPSYSSADYATSFHKRPYAPNTLADLSVPADLSNSDEDGSDFAQLTQATSTDVSMFDYSNLPTASNEYTTLPHLMGPGNGLALGISLPLHLQSFDQVLSNTSAIDDHDDNVRHDGLVGVEQPIAAFAPHSFPPYPAMSSTATQMENAFAAAQGHIEEPTHFHHYHRVPRLQQPHGHSHMGTPEVHTPIHEDGPMGSSLVLAQPWYPQQQQQIQHNQYTQAITVDSLLQHHPQPPRLYRHNTDTTISAEDVEEFERLASQEVVYARAIGAGPQLYDTGGDDETIVDGDLSQDRHDDFRSKAHLHMHGLAAVAAATQAGFADDADWELLPTMHHGSIGGDLDVIGHDDLTETEEL